MSKAKKVKQTPLMKQHSEIKAKYPDAVLLFRVGDFYETFGEDAVIASKVLGITLTKRANGAAAYIELAGFPYHAMDTYLHKLVKAGYRVAICDQLEDPKTVKGIVKRGVTELVTPGVATNHQLLSHNSNNFLAAVHLTEKSCGVCFLDISTGELFTAEGSIQYIDKLLQSFLPAEVLVCSDKMKFFEEHIQSDFYIYKQDDWIYQPSFAYETVCDHYGVQSLKGFGIDTWEHAIIAIGAAIYYLKDTEHPNLQHITSIQRINSNEFVWMDRFTIRNLELLQSNTDNGKSLLDVIDYTSTPMGARMLKQWLLFPLCNQQAIHQRHNAVTLFYDNPDLSAAVMNKIKQIGDIERLVARIPLRKVNPKELLSLLRSLEESAAIKHLATLEADVFADISADYADQYEGLVAQVNELLDVQELIRTTIHEDAPALLNKGHVIADGYDEELDSLRDIAYKGKDYLLQIQQRESAATGIPSLKIGFNNVFGYYIEVRNTHKDKVPEGWIRKQTLTSAERYITEELKTYEAKILGAEDKIAALELKIYQRLLDQLSAFIQEMQATAKVLAHLDCFLSFQQLAYQCRYVRPTITEEKKTNITQGRHPVIEATLPVGQPYIPNDVWLDDKEQQIIILTGPNMSGKSAILRQVALITLLAHVGSFVPAVRAEIALTDMIYTRVGASDNLSGGESTFMVEMNETASILNNLSSRSLVILDEIGRGTSTYDGISIAWSIVEYLHNHPAAPFTLFATHYHELNELEHKLKTVKNYHISHKESGQKVIFLRKLKRGGSHHSFGIQVAKMAGMPVAVTKRSEEILATLEAARGGAPDISEQLKQVDTTQYQLNIFDGVDQDLRVIKEKLYEVDINTLTPVEALLKLNELKEIVRQYGDLKV